MPESVQTITYVSLAPQIKRLAEAERQKKEKSRKRNWAMTGLSTAGLLAATAVTAKIASTEGAKNTGERIKKSVTTAGEWIVKQPVIKTVVEKVSQSKQDGLIRKIIDRIQKHPRVRNAALIGAGLIAGAHIYDAGKIKARFDGYNGANEGINNLLENAGDLKEKLKDSLGIKEEKQCTCGGNPCACK